MSASRLDLKKTNNTSLHMRSCEQIASEAQPRFGSRCPLEIEQCHDASASVSFLDSVTEASSLQKRIINVTLSYSYKILQKYLQHS
jgi:hypothetical protein